MCRRKEPLPEFFGNLEFTSQTVAEANLSGAVTHTPVQGSGRGPV